MGLSVRSRVSSGNGVAAGSIDHSASGLRAYARVIPAGFMGQHRGVAYLSALITDSVDSHSAVRDLLLRVAIASLIKSGRDRSRRPGAFLVAVSSVNGRPVSLDRSRARFTILSRLSAPIETLSRPAEPFVLRGVAANEK